MNQTNNQNYQQSYQQPKVDNNQPTDYKFDNGIYLYAKANKRINHARQPAWFGIVFFILYLAIAIVGLVIYLLPADTSDPLYDQSHSESVNTAGLWIMIVAIVLLIITHLFVYINIGGGLRKDIWYSNYKDLHITYIWYLTVFGWIIPIVSFIGYILLIHKINQLKKFYKENQAEIDAGPNPYNDSVALDDRQWEAVVRSEMGL